MTQLTLLGGLALMICGSLAIYAAGSFSKDDDVSDFDVGLLGLVSWFLIILGALLWRGA